jgi:CHAT domain-containing protein
MRTRNVDARAKRASALALLFAACTSVLAAEVCQVGSVPVPATLQMSGLGGASSRVTPLDEARASLRAGRYERAREILGEQAADERAPAAEQARALALLALASAGAGDFSATRLAARRAVAIEGLAPAEASAIALDTGVALANIGDDDAALAAFERAAGAEDGGTRTRALANAATLSARAGRPDAVARSAKALAAIQSLDDPALRSALLVTVGDSLVTAGSRDRVAYDVLKAGYESASAASNAGDAAQALGLIGSLQFVGGSTAEAARTLERASDLARAASDDVWGFRWQWMLGRVQRAGGDHAAALASFAKAVERLEESKSRHSLGARGTRVWREVYLDLADERLREAARAQDETSRQRSLVAARQALELSRAAEVEDFFNDPCIAARTARRTTPEEVDAKVAVIYPVPLDDRLEIIVGHRSGLARFTSPHTSRELAAAVQQLRVLLEKRTTRQYLRPARELYDALIRPIESHLAALGVQTLVIVPDGPLRTVPFAVLHDGKAFLVDRYALAVTPVASLTEPRALPASSIRALLSGLTEPRQGFAALPAVDEELKTLSALLNAPVYRDREFSSAALETALSKAPINLLHVASHGQFSRDPSETFVLTFDGHLTLAQLRRAIAAGKLREEPLELLTLSACQTATGDDRAALGLAGVALGAGARSALASLWAVNDESTSLLIEGFYENLVRKGMTKAAALRQAQIDLAHDERFAHPAYWAPFLVIGNWL